MAKKSKKGKKQKRSKHTLGKGEFLFNFISLVCMIAVGIYFGYRSLYYYSLQNRKNQEEAQTLNGFILQHIPVVYDDGEGLHHDSLGYYYKGNVTNNYVLFANRLFRIIRINEDGSVRMVTEENAAIFPWGNFAPYRDSNVYYWLNKTDWEYSGYYYNTLPYVEEFLVKTETRENYLEEGQITSVDIVNHDFISLININDYVLASGMNSYLNTGKMFFILGLTKENQNLYVEQDGSIQTCDTTEGYGIRPVITLKPNTIISQGDGTAEHPYVISQGEKNNYVGSYVKLGEDIWQVFYQDESVIKLYLNGYIMEDGVEKQISYSQTTSIYDIMNAANIGYYLNTQYYDSLPYQNLLIPFESYIGEISDDQGYQYSTIYKEKTVSNVALLNVFDPLFNYSLSDFYRINNTSPIGSMEYVTYSSGLLGEADVRDVKHIVPVICIDKNNITGGSGEINNPYIVG